MAESTNYEDLAKRLAGVIEAAIDGIITINQVGIIETINKSAAEQFGYAPNEVIGQNIKMLMPQPYRSEHDGYLKRYNETREARIIGIGREVTGKKKSGEEFPFRLAVSEVILNDRILFTGIIHDLSDIKAAEQRLVSLNIELERKVELRTVELEDSINKLLSTNQKLNDREQELQLALAKEKELSELKSRFVSMASHEFRTPLSTILSSASLISKYTEEAQNEKREKHIKRIKSAVNNLTGILNDFLSLSKIEEGKVDVNKKKFDFAELCNDIKQEVKGILKKDQKIKLKLDDDLIIYTDRRVLKNIMFNLISNAIKYSNEGTTIVCTVFREADKILFEVQDQGIGIPEDEQKYIFSRFFRANNVENIQGTGLGLNIVKRYVELLGGEIQFESRLGEGTTFKFNLPVF